MKSTKKRESENHTERIGQQCEQRAKLWKEHVASYQKVLDETPEAFSVFSAEFRERFVRATADKTAKDAPDAKS